MDSKMSTINSVKTLPNAILNSKLWSQMVSVAMQFYWMIEESDSARYSQLLQTMRNIKHQTVLGNEFLTKISPHTRGNGWQKCLARHFNLLFPHVCGGLNADISLPRTSLLACHATLSQRAWLAKGRLRRRETIHLIPKWRPITYYNLFFCLHVT